MFDALAVSYFFFRAEDGIRDATVTGVQTCALPIFMPCTAPFPDQDCARADFPRRHDFGWLAHSGIFGDALEQSADGRLETPEHVLLDSVRNRSPKPVPAQMWRRFDFVEKLPLGSQLSEIE